MAKTYAERKRRKEDLQLIRERKNDPKIALSAIRSKEANYKKRTRKWRIAHGQI